MADRLTKILKNTLQSIQNGKEEIFFIAESTRSETERLSQELDQLIDELKSIILEVDYQEKTEKVLRQKLMEVNRDYKIYTEKEMMDTYTQAKDAQVNLQLLRAREKHLRNRRDEIERSLRQMEKTIERAENLITQIGIAVNLLQSGLAEVSSTNEFRQNLGLRVIQAQEEERRRVAREIHDGPAQTLANIVLRLEIAEKLLELDPERVKLELADLKKLVRTNLQDIRRIIFDLRPMALDDLGLVPALKKYTENYILTYGIGTELKIEGREKRLPPALEVGIFRLIQEGMTNAAKHSMTDKVIITLRFDGEMLKVIVNDFGQGFDVKSVLSVPDKHFGLLGIKERIEMLSGSFLIESTQGKGTSLHFSIPSHQEEAVQ